MRYYLACALHADVNPKHYGPLCEKMQLLEVFPGLAQEKLKSSQIKRKSSLIQLAHFKAFKRISYDNLLCLFQPHFQKF